MNTYIGTFIKANGKSRTMKFAKLVDLPDDFLKDRVKGGDLSEARVKAKQKMQDEGMETVWDLESNNFRVFNWNTVVDEVLVQETEEFNFF